MSQDVIISAFRKRLKNRGYLNIRISRTSKPDKYFISFIEPIFRRGLEGILSLSEMHHSAR